MLTYAGHGGQLPDLNGDEPDGLDETWCLYDGQLIDDEIYFLLGQFKPDTRILVFSDSCHSGSVVRNAYYAALPPGGEAIHYRNMPLELTVRTYYANKAFYDGILLDPKLKDAESQVTASVMLIAGCHDNQKAGETGFHGLFTATLLHVWNGGKFQGDYQSFHKAIVGFMPPIQTPELSTYGKIDPMFSMQRPFSI